MRLLTLRSLTLRSLTLTACAGLTLVALALLAAAHPRDTSGVVRADQYVAVVLGADKGCVYRDDGSPQPQPLLVNATLRPGHQFQCASGGKVTFRYVQSRAEVTLPQKGGDWYTVVNVPPRNSRGCAAGRIS
jgi:hypothetical protein